MYNFDEIIDRRGSRCLKYDSLKERYGREDLNSMWIADMDFRTPDFIIEALRRRLDHPVLGYPSTGADFPEILSRWTSDMSGWTVPSEDFCFIPGIVKGIGLAERCFLQPGDKVIIQPPVYHPFRIVAQKCGFEVVYNPLKPVYDSEGFLKTYEMDFDNLESVIDDKVKMLVLSNPHNPCGVAFTAETLRRLASICSRHGIIVISDEIHGDMTVFGHRHIPFGSVSHEAAQCSITFGAPSKTFNIPGVVSSYCIVSNPELKARFFGYLDAVELDYPCIFSAEATRAAYTEEGKEWLREMLAYIEKNILYVESYLKAEIPMIHAVRPQASFLIWLDCRKLGLSQEELVDLFVNKAHLALNDGSMFGREGTGYMRMNIACPASVVRSALESLDRAVKAL